MKHRLIIPAFVAATALSGAAFAQDDEYTDQAGQPGNSEFGQERAGQEAGQPGNSEFGQERAGERSQVGQQGQSQPGQGQTHESGQHQMQQDFTQVDRDQDGFLSTEEARDALPEAIVIVDINNDGMLNRDEVQQALPEVGFTGESASQTEGVGEEDWLLIIEEVERQGMGSGQGQGQGQGQPQAEQPQAGSEFEG